MNKNEIWSSYLDGELSLETVEKLENNWTTKQKTHLLKEKEFEKSLNTQLSQNCDCPQSLWNSIERKVSKSERKNRAPVIFLSALLMIAATITLVFNLDLDKKIEPPITITELTDAALTGKTYDEVNMFLKENKINIQLLTVPAHKRHHQELIGANIETIQGEDIPVIYFNCCGSAVKVYIIPHKSRTEKQFQTADFNWSGGITAQAKKNDYRLALVSKHGGINILESFT